MQESKQLRLDLNDRQQYFKQKIEQEWLGSDSDWYIFLRRFGVAQRLYLGIRTHGLGGTDYSYLNVISLEEAEWLLKTPFANTNPNDKHPTVVYEFMDAIKKCKEFEHNGE